MTRFLLFLLGYTVKRIYYFWANFREWLLKITIILNIPCYMQHDVLIWEAQQCRWYVNRYNGNTKNYVNVMGNVVALQTFLKFSKIHNIIYLNEAISIKYIFCVNFCLEELVVLCIWNFVNLFFICCLVLKSSWKY